MTMHTFELIITCLKSNYHKLSLSEIKVKEKGHLTYFFKRKSA